MEELRLRARSRCRLMDRMPRGATSSMAGNLSSSFSFVSVQSICLLKPRGSRWLSPRCAAARCGGTCKLQSRNKWIFVVRHRRKKFGAHSAWKFLPNTSSVTGLSEGGEQRKWGVELGLETFTAFLVMPPSRQFDELLMSSIIEWQQGELYNFVVCACNRLCLG